MRGSKSLLPPSVTALLDELGDQLARGCPTDEVLEAALSALDPLPPHVIGRARREIVERCGLWSAPRRLEPVPSLISRLLPILNTRSPQSLFDDMPGLEYLFLFHWDGFLREAALDRLNGPARSPFFFAAITYRLNDWVGRVRAAAARCAERVFPATGPQIVAEAAASLLGRTDEWRRWEGEALLLDQAFGREDVAASLAETFRSATSGPLARVLRHALRQTSMDRHLLSLVREALVPPVRAIALRTLIEGRATWPAGFRKEWVDKSHDVYRRVHVFQGRPVHRPLPLHQLVAIGAADKSAAVRRIAAQAVVEHHASLPNLDTLLGLFLEDRSGSVRERAEFVMKVRAEV